MNPLVSDPPHLAVTRFAGECPPARPQWPRNECFEFVFVEAGQGWQRVGRRTLRARAGDLFLVAPRESHPLAREDGLTTWVVALEAQWLRATPSFNDGFAWSPDDVCLATLLQIPPSSARCFHVEPAEHSRWILRLMSLADELRACDMGANVAVHALVRLLLVDLARLARRYPVQRSSRVRPILVRVFSYIDHHFRSPIGLADVAKAVARSPSYLTDLVRRETGRTVLQWIIHRRIAEARRLLLDPSVRVKDVAPRIGYDDTGHFIRQFRRLNGQTPQQWRAGGQAPRIALPGWSQTETGVA